VSSAFDGGYQLQRTQGTGVPPAAERACENSDLRRLADPLAAVRRYTSGHRTKGKALRRATAGATCLQATGPESVGLALYVRRFAVPACFCSPTKRALPSFVCHKLRVHNPQGLPLGMLVPHKHSRLLPLLCSLLRPLLLLHTICSNTPYTPPSLSLSLASLSFHFCPSPSHCHLLSVCLCVSLSLSLSLSLSVVLCLCFPLLCSLIPLSLGTLSFTHHLSLMLLFLLLLSLSLCLCVLVCV